MTDVPETIVAAAIQWGALVRRSNTKPRPSRFGARP